MTVNYTDFLISMKQKFGKKGVYFSLEEPTENIFMCICEQNLDRKLQKN